MFKKRLFYGIFDDLVTEHLFAAIAIVLLLLLVGADMMMEGAGVTNLVWYWLLSNETVWWLEAAVAYLIIGFVISLCIFLGNVAGPGWFHIAISGLPSRSSILYKFRTADYGVFINMFLWFPNLMFRFLWNFK